GHQKYDQHHLCKHLVKEVAPLSKQFWHEVIQHWTIPIYQHPELRGMDNSQSVEEVASDGGITDGDDHIWSGNKDVLK
ncbi:hypothetical protein L208DRAFT_1219920, partial [Tricholoma matsutake]